MNIMTAVARRWMLVVACLLLGLGGAVGYSLLSPQTFTATVRTYIATGTSDMLEAYQGSQAAQASIQTFAVLATDPAVAQRALDRAGVGLTVAEFLPQITVAVPPQTVVLDITVRNKSAQDAQLLAPALADELVGLVGALQQPTSGGPGALKLVVVDPSTQGAVRQQLLDPIVLASGAVGGGLIGVVVALVLERRARPRGFGTHSGYRPEYDSAHRYE